MIEGQTILCFASGYDAPPTSKHHVMHILAERNVVLWVNYHASRAPTASSSDLTYMAKKLGQVVADMKNPRDNLFVLTPLVIPLPGSGWAKRLNRAVGGGVLRLRRTIGVFAGGRHPGPHGIPIRRSLEHGRRSDGCRGLAAVRQVSASGGA